MSKKAYQVIGAFLFMVIYQILKLLFESFEYLDYAMMIPALVLLGIPHGATDHILHSATHKQKIEEAYSLLFFIKYLAVVLLFGACWILLPSACLLLFLLISSAHFGETQWFKFNKKPASSSLSQKLIEFSWGAGLFSILFLMYAVDAFPYIADIVPKLTFSVWFQILQFSTVSFTLIWIVLAIRFIEINYFIRQLIDLVLIILIFKLTSLLIGFTCYFVFWHSVDAIGLQIKGIQNLGIDFNTRLFFKSAFPISMISILGIILILFLFHTYSINTLSLTTLFFILISVITLPHHIEVGRFYRKVKSLGVS